MSRKIRKGNDIDINWSLLDKDRNPYIVEGRNFAIELLVGNTKRVRISDATASGNTIHFTYYGKDQKVDGPVNLIYIENGGEVDMVTFDTKDAFTMVPHSWLAVDDDETPETVTLDVVTVVSELNSSIGPRGYSAYEIAVQHGETRTEEEWLASLKPLITADENGNVYCDGVLLTDVIYRVVSTVSENEQERVEAERLREEQSSADHAQAERDHAAADEDHADAESDHTRAERDHELAEEAIGRINQLGPATESKDGLMSAGDKVKLNGVEQGAQKNAIEIIKVDGTALPVDGDKAVNITLSQFITKAEPLTYADLAELRRTGKLVPGKSYRITDYVATTAQADTRSANHPFDIVVMAISETNLSEDAKAVLHEGDTYFSQAGAKLDAWVVKYCFDNDATRFAWADTENGKGVIYRLKDEWGNDLPYDFKGVQFKRWYVASVDAKYQDALSPLVGLPIAHKWSRGLVRDDASFKWYYTFSMLGQTWDDEVTDGSLNGESTNGNVIKASLFYKPILSDLVCANGPVLHNFLLSLLPSGGSSNNDPRYISANNEYDGESMVHNSFFGTNANVFTASQFRRNTVVGCHRHSTYETDCQDNTIFCTDDYSMNQTGHYFAENVIVSPIFSGLNAEDDFMRNFFHLTTQGVYGHFGNNFQNNTIIGEVVNTCSIGTYFFNNTLTDIYLSSTQINGQVSECVFTGRVTACSIKGIIQHLIIPGGDSSNRFYGVDIVGNIRGTAEAKISLNHPAFFLSSVSGVRRRVKIEGDTDGNIVATWKEGGQTVGVMKAPGANEWTDIPAVEVDSMTAQEITDAVDTAWNNIM